MDSSEVFMPAATALVWREVVPRNFRRVTSGGALLGLLLLITAHPSRAQLIQPDVAVVSGFPVQNEPQVAESGGAVVAVWYQSTSLRFSGWGLSIDGGATWVQRGAFPIHTNGGGNFGQPTVCADYTGRFYAATLYSLAGLTVGVYRATLQAGSLVWDGPQFATPLISSQSDPPRPLDAPRLTCDPERGHLYLSYTRTRGVAAYQYEYTIQFVRSLDGGITWTAPQVLSSGVACNGSRPVVGPDGEVYVVWEDLASQQVRGRRSVDFGASFGPEFTVGAVQDNPGTPPWSWHPPQWRRDPIHPLNRTLASNYPSLAVDRSSGPRRGRLYAVWTDHAEGPVGPATQTRYEQEPNHQYFRATPVLIGEDFAGSLPASEFNPDDDRFTFTGTAGTTIRLNGRLTFASGPQPQSLEYWVECHPDTGQFSLTLRNELLPAGYPQGPPILYTLPADGRYYISVPGSHVISYSYEFSLRAVVPAAGQAALDHRDVVLTWSDDGGVSWAEKRRVSDAPPRYDESFPAVAVDEQGRVHLAWYDRRDEPDCGIRAHVYWTYSLDGGASFAPSQRVSSESSTWKFVDGSVFNSNIGDHLGLTAGGGRVHVLWTDNRAGVDFFDGGDIYAVRIEDLPTGIAVPRFVAEVVDGIVHLAWTVRDASGITGFRLHRAEGERGVFAELDQEPRTISGPGDYRAEDHSVSPGTSYRYRLEVLRGGAPSEWEGPAAVTLPAPIARLAWRGVGPNPFDRSVRLELAVPRGGEAWVRVYDLAGHEVVTLHRGVLPAGLRTFTWEGRDKAGRSVAAGVYLVRVELAGERTSRRLVRIQ